jgi:hypothetical protein
MTKKILFILTILTYSVCGNLLYSNNLLNYSNYSNYKVETKKNHTFSAKNEIENDFQFINFDIEEDNGFDDDLEKQFASIHSDSNSGSYFKKQKSYSNSLFCTLHKKIPLYDLFCIWKIHTN